MVSELLLSNLLVPRAMVVGLCGAAGLILIYWFGRFGQLMVPAYAALFGALAWSAARHPAQPFGNRFVADLLAFVIATGGVYTLANYSAAQDCKRRFANDVAAPADGKSVGEHAMHIGLIIAVGTMLSAIVAFRG